MIKKPVLTGIRAESEEKKMKKYGNNDRYAIHVFNVLKEIEYWYYRATKRAAENVAVREHNKNGEGTICVIHDMKNDTTISTYC